MAKNIFLASCSALALCGAAAPASAQQVQVPQDSTSQPPTVEAPTSLPLNSDAADDEKVRDRVEERRAEVSPQEAERVRQERIADFRREGAKKAMPASEDGSITVTGSRLRDGDPTSRLTVIDAQEIRARGVTSVEELIRTLPQNVATIGAITNNRTRGPLNDGKGNSVVSAVGGLGVAAANLGGVGAGNTLILVNGRRIAGAAGIEQGYANLNGIPLNAIERVEISNGGASAIYGADALGGVINFILKKNYVGTTVSVQHEESSGGADNTRVNLYSGYAWGSGNLSASVDFSRRKAIVNSKTGYVTNNYAPSFGGDERYDKRSLTAGLQPGVVVRPAVYDPETFETITPEIGLTVPKGFTGAPTLDDLVEIGLNNARDYVPTYAGPESRSASATLSFEQNITPKLRLFGNGLYTRAKNSQESNVFNGISLILGPGQAYNPFPAYGLNSYSAGTTISYFPESEIADGSLPSGRISNLTKSWNVNLGVGYEFSRLAKLELVYTRSSSSTVGSNLQLNSAVTSFIEDASSPSGYACYSEGLALGTIPARQRAAYRAAFERQCQLLTSADPAVAFNPWKSTSNGGGSSIAAFLLPELDSVKSTLENFEGRLTGTAIKLPGGDVNYAMGAEYARTGAQNDAITTVTSGDAVSTRYAFFGEMTLPILGRNFTLPLMKRLMLNVAVRRDVTSSTGAIGTVDDIPIDQGGELLFGKNRFGRTTPSYGALWSPTNTIDVRAKFTTGFKAPPPTQLFTALGTSVYTTQITDDPLYTCTTDCLAGTTNTYEVPARVAPNPNLKPETSRQQVYSITWQPTGWLTGLNLAVTYNRNRIRNQFATIQDLYAFLPNSEILKIAQFYPRDASGKIISQQNMRFNIIGSNYESLTYEASYTFDTGLGSFQPKVTFVDNLVAETVGTQRQFVVSQLGKILGVDQYRWVGSLQWNKGPVSANLFVYHTPSYLNDYMSYYYAGLLSSTDLVTKVDALTTVDLSASWVVANGVSLQFAGRNILKAKAPFTFVDNLPYDTSRYNVAGRTLSLSAQLSF